MLFLFEMNTIFGCIFIANPYLAPGEKNRMIVEWRKSVIFAGSEKARGWDNFNTHILYIAFDPVLEKENWLQR